MTTLRQMVWKLIEEIDNQTSPWALGTLADELRDYMNDNPEALPTDDELNELWDQVWTDPNRIHYMHTVYAYEILKRWGRP